MVFEFGEIEFSIVLEFHELEFFEKIAFKFSENLLMELEFMELEDHENFSKFFHEAGTRVP